MTFLTLGLIYLLHQKQCIMPCQNLTYFVMIPGKYKKYDIIRSYFCGGFREDLVTFVDPSRGVSSNFVTAGSMHVLAVGAQPSSRTVAVELRRKT